jgi:RHS repeat-associated protein
VHTATMPVGFSYDAPFRVSQFTGKERDSESGLDEFGARYYASPLGRFMTPDWEARPTDVPYAHFGNPQSLNLYSYVENNPITTGDPDGHDGPGSALAEVEEVVNEVGKVVVELAPEEAEAAEEGSALGPAGAVAAASGVAIVGVSAYEYNKHFKNPGPPPAPPTPKPPTGPPPVTGRTDAAPSPEMSSKRHTHDKHFKKRPGTSPPPNYKPDREYKQPKDDKQKDREKPYHRKDRDKKDSSGEYVGG